MCLKCLDRWESELKIFIVKALFDTTLTFASSTVTFFNQGFAKGPIFVVIEMVTNSFYWNNTTVNFKCNSALTTV